MQDEQSIPPAPLGEIVKLKLNAGQIAEILATNPDAEVEMCIDLNAGDGHIRSISSDGFNNFYLYNFNCEKP